ncbi:hypothetical protein RND61_30615 [Streptomyces sp. TRM76323]|uniref:Transposase n=1 Tax=Streptomyces tamarix TaxID=3078565 RepID=A0ABU3QUE7_9ACTN|nr:hypothetical protein [Streptomyces tamarix]MDT9686391.1 hypothetical protein [Streptomyces tamarix]
MSTARRRLGTGPSTKTTPPAGPAPRLLPVERIEAERLLDDVEHQAVVEHKGRRTLGPGIAREPEGSPGK